MADSARFTAAAWASAMSRVDSVAERGRALTDRLPEWVTRKVPRDHHESDAAFARRRRVVAGVAVTGSALLGAALSTKPDSRAFYVSTTGVAAIWTGGAFASGPLHLGYLLSRDSRLERPVLAPLAAGAGAFGVFYGGALIARHIPVLEEALRHVLRFADQGSTPLVVLTTIANGAAEELFFRGALFAAIGEKYPVPVSTVVYMLTTCATRNPALVLAAGAMGVLLGVQRRATGGVQAPIITHAAWSALMLRYLPPLFRRLPHYDGS